MYVISELLKKWKMPLTINKLLQEPPFNKITITVVGIGGTGSLILPILMRFNYALQKLKGFQLQVNAVDFDTVSESNPARQGFSEFEIGMNKANALVNRINRFSGSQWETTISEITKNTSLDDYASHIIITCTDTRKSREIIETQLSSKYRIDHEYKPLYWIDAGNSKLTGNIIMTDFEKLPSVTEFYKKWPSSDKDKGPSCSVAESLNSQDILINQYMAIVTCDLVWDLITLKKIEWCGAFINSEKLNIKKIKI